MSITTQAMTVNLQISMWTGHRLDKDASMRVTNDANAEQDAARVNKHLIPKETLKPIHQAVTALRLHFYEKTLPWKDNGERLLPRKMYVEFLQRHHELTQAYDAAVETFLTQTYPSARDQAAFRMGALFKSDDYPTTAQLRRKFGVTLTIDAVAEASDFRVIMDADQAQKIRGDMTQQLQQRIGRAMQDVWQRLADTLGHFAEKMNSDAIFRDSTVKNLEELVEVLPGLNVLDDPHLDEILEQVKQAILPTADPAQIRKTPALRQQLGADAQAIINNMSAFMAAFEEAA